ncbi:MAG: arginine--tRNA ligase [Clostridia bacterium]|nr:arginine--tRNA ligase [Clostridia bacterium]
MSAASVKFRTQAKETIIAAFGAAFEDGSLAKADIPDFNIEVPADSSHGDLSTNAEMMCARAFKLAPVKIASIIIDHAKTDGTYIDRIETAGPGFINFYPTAQYFCDIVSEVVEKGGEYGRSDHGKGKRVMVEFVSANPTGPMHMGNARGGALGDCLAAVMDAAGYEVSREFYINDAGNQIEKFALSLDVRYLQLVKGEDFIEIPEDAYHGADIIDRAQEFLSENGAEWADKPEAERRKALVDFALPKNIARMQSDLLKYRIEYDVWFRESALHNDGSVKEAIELLSSKGMTYEKDGAIWYKATDRGAEKDEVLIRANGNPTYFAADIAYHIDKFKRGFDLCINVWGADHHGHVARMKGALDAAGYDGEKLEVVLMQLVNLVQDGKPVKMSKRTGKAIQLADLLDEVPVDAARFFFNLRESTTQMDFDLDLAVKQDSENPVYYVQYAHARICSIFRKYAEQGGNFVPADIEQLMLLTAPEELELIRYLSAYDSEIIAASDSREPSRITRYVMELAAKYHKFYNACWVIGEDEALTRARLTLCHCTKQVIANVLDMFRINAPEQMI